MSGRASGIAGSRRRGIVATTAALVATAAAKANGPQQVAAVIVAVLAAAGLVHAVSTVLRGRGASRAALAWTAMPLVEGALVRRLPMQHDPIVIGVAAAFYAWGLIGCTLLLRERGEDDDTAIVMDKRIRFGSEAA